MRFQEAGTRRVRKPNPHQRASQSHGRGIGRLFGSGMRPVTSGCGSSADALVFCARFRIASAAR